MERTRWSPAALGRRTMVAAIALILPLATGCQPTDEQIAEMMKQPPRPAELDRLNAWVGNWSDEYTCCMPNGKEMKGTGNHTVEWSTDNWILVENWSHTMGDEDTMKGVGLYWWDNNKKKYRMAVADNYGGHGEGSMKYDEETDTWHMKTEMNFGKGGHESHGKGTMKMPNDTTMEWHFAEYGPFWIKMMEFNGTSKKQ